MIYSRDRLLAEGSTRLGAIMAFVGFEAEGAAGDQQGLRADALEAALQRGRPPKLLYVILIAGTERAEPEHGEPAEAGRGVPTQRPAGR